MFNMHSLFQPANVFWDMHYGYHNASRHLTTPSSNKAGLQVIAVESVVIGEEGFIKNSSSFLAGFLTKVVAICVS